MKQNQKKPVTYKHLPRWRGFNLMEKFVQRVPDWNRAYQEWDLDFMAEWGFDFIRLPTDYRIWTISPGEYVEQPLKEIDQVIKWARDRKIHVNLCLHRGPGYCVNPPKEPLTLWDDSPGGKEAQRQFAVQWKMFAIRYKGIPSTELSFNLINEPSDITGEQYARGVIPAINSIQEIDPTRLIIADGTNYGRKPAPELVSPKIAQSTRGYDPLYISHYKAQWMKGSDQWAEPTWPLTLKSGDTRLYSNGEDAMNNDRLWMETVKPWIKFQKQYHIGVHVGEWGAFHKTPHSVVLAWMKDCLENWQKAGFGWALWNLRGGFGILDSARADVVYEDYKGHKLDRKMLELLRQG